MRFCPIFALLLLLAGGSVAAEGGDAKDRHRAYSAFDTLVAGCRLRPQWQEDGSLTYTVQTSGKAVSMRLVPKTGRISSAPTKSEIAPSAVPRSFEREIWGVIDSFPEIASPTGREFALIKDGNLRIRRAGGAYEALTRDAEGDISWDVETMTANPWSPDGQALFALRYDRRGLPKLPQIVYGGADERVNLFNQQRAGGPLDLATAHIVRTNGEAPISVDLGDTRDRYLNLLGWTHDGSRVLITRSNRTFTQVELLSISARDGTVRLLFSEMGKSFVRVMHEVIFQNDMGFTMLPEGKGFLWESERDGWNQLYHYDLAGNLVRKLTAGPRPVQKVVQTGADGHVYFLASGDEARPYDRHLYRIALEGGAQQRLTEGPGRHDVLFSPDGSMFLDSYSTPAFPPRHVVRGADGRQVRLLPESDLSMLRSIGWTPPEEVIVKAADGKTDLHGLIYKPSTFDPARRYPLVEYVYGGPQTAYVPRTFCRGSAPWNTSPSALAEKGFVILILDGRGTPGRSKGFHDAVMGDWAGHVVADHAGAIRQLARAKPYIDASRVGVMGRSWGGYFAYRFLVDAPETYRAGVTIVPGFDPRASSLYEPYLGMPDINRPAYEAADPFRLAPRLFHPYMLVGASLDYATLGDVMRMSRVLVAADKDFDHLILPDQDHVITGHSAAYLADRVERFFTLHLRPGQGAASSATGSHR